MFLKVLANDLSTSVVPMLVLVLQTSFAMGTKEQSRDTLPREGTFTWTTVQYVSWASSWLVRVHGILAQEESQHTRERASPAPAEQQDPDNATHNRTKFGVMVKKWKQHLKEAVDRFNEEGDKKRDIEEKIKYDAERKARRRKEEEARRAADERYNELVNARLREIQAQPRPMALKWTGSTAPQPVPTQGSTSSSATQTPTPTPTQTQTQTQSQSYTLSVPTTQARQTPRPPASDYPPWPEDEVEWFLRELVRPDRSRDHLAICAETLDRTMAEVRAEKERLRREGRYWGRAQW